MLVDADPKALKMPKIVVSAAKTGKIKNNHNF